MGVLQVLLVEDNPGDARLVREALKDAESLEAHASTFRLHVAERLELALQLLDHEPIDVVLLDLSLPDSEGFDTFARMHVHAPDCAIVVLTRTDDTSLGARAIREGAQDYLAKSQFDAVSLARSLRYARERKQAERDRSQLIRAEAARLEAEQQRELLQALFDGAQDAILIADDEARYVDANGAASTLLQRTREEILHLSVTDLSPSYPREARAAWARFLREGQQRGEFSVHRPDGSSRVVEYVAKANIQPGRHLSIIRDVTDRKAAEAERAALHARERTARVEADVLARAGVALASVLSTKDLLQSIAQLVIPELADWSCIYLHEDGGGLRLVAAAHVDAASEPLLWEIFARHGLYPETPFAYRAVMRSGASHLIADMPEAVLAAMAGNAEHRSLIERLAPRSGMSVPLAAAGRTFGVLTFVASVSGRRYTESDLRLASELGQRVAVALESARLFDLAQRERRRAEEANRAKDEFLSVASHELRTPLNAILGWAGILRSRTLPPDKVARALETIERNAYVQVKLIEDILDVSRITSGNLRLDLVCTELAPVAEAAVDVVRPAADSKGVRLRMQVAPELGSSMIDGARLQQVIWNLLSNAVKFTPAGGRVELTLDRDESGVRIAVTDTGLGIDAHFLPHVFDPFRQADASVTRASGGLGLGLSIVKHLVELHGGSILAESKGQGHGSTFTVRLPLVGPGTVPPDSGHDDTFRSQSRLACPPELRGIHILVVDDERDARELLAQLLEECEAHVTMATSADEALRRIREDRPDLLVSDIGMPGEDGYSLVGRLRQLPPEEGGRIPAVALTAYARVEDRTRALRAGFTNHVSKPLVPGQILAVLAAAVAVKAGSSTRPS